MQKLVASFCVLTAILPLAFQTSYQFKQQTENTQTLKPLHNFLADKNKYNPDGSINWDDLGQTTINSIINKTQENQTQLSQDYFAEAKSNVIALTQEFKAAHLTNGKQAKKYLLNDQKIPNHDKFVQYYRHPGTVYQKNNDKIMETYFGPTALDLHLDGLQTYQSTVDILLKNIKLAFPTSVVKIALNDPKQVNQTLFDDSNINQIIAFVNNQVTINVTVTINQQKPVKTAIRLTNILLNPIHDVLPLYEAIKSYFDSSFPLNLHLNAKDTVKSALDKVVQKIEKRFQINIPDDGTISNHISLAFLTGIKQPHQFSANSTFTDADLIKDAFTGNFYFNISLIDNDLKTISHPEPFSDFKIPFYLPKIDFDADSIKSLLNQLFSTNNSINNQQDLSLTTNDTLQTALKNFQKKLNNYSPAYQFQTNLIDPKMAQQKLQAQYNPANPNQNFYIDITISYLSNQTTTNLGQYRIYLSNVLLDEASQKLLTTFESFQAVSKKLDEWGDYLNLTSDACAIGATAFWIAVCFNPAAVPEALGLTAAAIVTGLGGAIIDLDVTNADNAMNRWTKVMFQLEDIYTIGQTFYYCYLTYLAAADISLGAFDWISLIGGTIIVFLEVISEGLYDSGIIS